MFSVNDKTVNQVVWRGTHTGYEGNKAVGKLLDARDFAVWRFTDGKVTEISTIQDQFALLKQIGYFSEEVYAAYPALADRGRRTAGRLVRILPGRTSGPVLTSYVLWFHVDSAGKVAAPMDRCRGINEPLSFSSRLGES